MGGQQAPLTLARVGVFLSVSQEVGSRSRTGLSSGDAQPRPACLAGAGVGRRWGHSRSAGGFLDR